MKRGLGFLGIALVLILALSIFSSFALAEDTTPSPTDGTTGDTTNDGTAGVSLPPASDIKQQAGQAGEGVKKVTQNFLEADLVIPDYLKILALVTIGIKENSLTIIKLIVYIIVWILVYIFTLEILSFSAFSKKMSYIIAACIVIVSAISGALDVLVSVFWGISNIKPLAWLDSLGIFGKLLLIVGIIALFILLITILRFIKRRLKIAKAKEIGTEAGVGLREAKQFGKIVGKGAAEAAEE